MGKALRRQLNFKPIGCLFIVDKPLKALLQA